MDPLDRLVEQELHQIKQFRSPPTSRRYECIIHTPAADIAAFQINEVTVLRDYLARFSDVIAIEVLVAIDQAVFDIKPYLGKIRMTLKTIVMEPGEYAIDVKDEPPNSFEYKAFLYDTSSDILRSQSVVYTSRRVASQAGMMRLRFQLLGDVTERLRAKEVGMTFRQCKPMDAIRYILGHYSQEEGDEAAAQVTGVTAVPGFTEEVNEHICIESPTRCIDAPRVIEEYVGGIYPTGMGYYLQNNQWYVFSPFDLKAFDKAPKRLTLINLMKDRLKSPERSYRFSDAQVTVLCTGDVQHVDISESQQLNEGNAVRFIDANQLVDGFVQTGGNKAVASISKNTRLYAVNDREEQDNVVGRTETRLTTNYLLEMGKLAQRNGSLVQIAWENSNDSLIFPGMPVRFIYATSKNTKEAYGIVVGTETLTQNVTNNPVDRQMKTNTALTLFIQRGILPSQVTELDQE